LNFTFGAAYIYDLLIILSSWIADQQLIRDPYNNRRNSVILINVDQG